MTWVPKTAPFTKYTDFVGEIRIPNLVPSTYTTDDPPVLLVENVVGDAMIAEVERYIAKYERKLFVKLLGDDVYTDLVAQMSSVSEPDQKWIDLYDALMTNPIAASYAYYWWMRDVESSTGSIGEVITSAENATRTTGSHKAIRAWNEMVEWLPDVVDFIIDNEDDYGMVTLYEVDPYAVLDEFQYINFMSI